MNKVIEDLIQTIERNAVDNEATITNVSLWAKSWRREQEEVDKHCVINRLCMKSFFIGFLTATITVYFAIFIF